METKRRQELLAQLKALDTNERNKLQKKASEQRKRQLGSARGFPTQRKQVNYDEDYERRPPAARKTPSLEDIMLAFLDEETKAASRQIEGRAGIVVAIAKGRADVHSLGQRMACSLAPDIEQRQQTELSVGDEVVINRHGEGWRVEAVAPRRSWLSRPDPAAKIERVIVANVDLVVSVVSVVAPPLHPRIIDRMMIAAGKGNVELGIAVNKIDLLPKGDPQKELEKLAPYRRLGIKVVEVSAEAEIGIESLREIMTGKRCAFIGHSGVGKSSLLNAIAPEIGAATGGVSEGNSRGAHTTRSSTLYDLGENTQIIDTPGVRSFGLWQLKADEVAGYFPEFASIGCRFRDCSHRVEPGCGVLAAIEDGALDRDRYETYLRILDSL